MMCVRQAMVRCLAALAAACLAWGALALSDGRAQTRWQQTVEVIVPVEDDGLMAALIDSMTTVFERRDAWVKRAPRADSVRFDQLERELSADGLSTLSASHAFITYRFQLTERGFQTDIRDLHFIYRPPGAQEDLSIFYVDLASSPLYDALLVERGTTLSDNEMAFLEFEQQLSLHRLADEVTIVRLGNEIIRDAERAAEEKKRIIEITTQLAHQELG